MEMFRAMNAPHLDEARWQAAAHQWFENHLADEQVFIAVVEHHQQVVATAMGAIRDSVPSPGCPDGGDILISNVSTLPAARRQGHARAAFEAVMGWARSTGIRRAELMATGEGRSMYCAAGFAATAHPAMRASL